MEAVILDDGVRLAVAKYAPHLVHVSQGTILPSGRRSPVVSIRDEIVVKHGRNVTHVQADTLRFIAEATNVPVPHVKGFCQDEEGNGYLVLSCFQGTRLDGVWDSLELEEKDNIISELAEYFRELHSLTATYVGTVGKGPPIDEMFEGAEPAGPYETEREMNEAVLRARRPQWECHGGHPPEAFVSTTLSWLPVDHKIVFAHGNLCMEHILVDTSKKVVGIVGWSRAGFFPEYWDFVNALVGRDMFKEWIKFIPFVLKPFYSEYGLWYKVRLLACDMYP